MAVEVFRQSLGSPIEGRMILALCLLAVGVIVGIPITLYGFMRLDENGGRSGLIILLLGLAVIVGPTIGAMVLHQETSGTGRYNGR